MSHSVAHETSLFILICLLSLFFFPATVGPYPAVHGPVTALQAMRLAVRLRNAIASMARSGSTTPVADRTGYISIVRGETRLGVGDSGSRKAILRC